MGDIVMRDIIIEIEDICGAIYTVGVAAGNTTSQELIDGLSETRELLTKILCEKVKSEIDAELSLSKLGAINMDFDTGDDRK